MNLRQKLFELEDKKYKAFSNKLTKTRYPMIGVRIPLLKKMARDYKNENLSFDNAIYFEEIMVEGLLIGYLKDIDLVLVMSVEPGKGGQSFIEESEERIKEVRELLKSYNIFLSN